MNDLWAIAPFTIDLNRDVVDISCRCLLSDKIEDVSLFSTFKRNILKITYDNQVKFLGTNVKNIRFDRYTPMNIGIQFNTINAKLTINSKLWAILPLPPLFNSEFIIGSNINNDFCLSDLLITINGTTRGIYPLRRNNNDLLRNDPLKIILGQYQPGYNYG